MRIRGQYLDSLLAVLASFAMYNLGLGYLVFTFPLLVLSKRTSRELTDTACVAVMVLVLLKLLYTYRDSLSDALTFALIGVNLFVPLSLILGALVWVNTNGKALFDRILLMCVPSFLVFFGLEVWFVMDQNLALRVMEEYRGHYLEMVKALSGEISETSETVFKLFMYGTLGSVVALSSLVSISNAFLASISARYFYDDEKDKRIMFFRIPSWFIYPFLGLWACILSFNFVEVPASVLVAVMNLALFTMVIYGLQGFAIVYFNLKKRYENLRVIRLFLLMSLLMLLFVGANLILWIGLPLLGVLENWIPLRKRKQGVYTNEDHSL
ncbi:MAG: hypothetical protein K6G51_00730 [Sphaerochaetaceae bacterium]|nr:hypothetical protein [Sphaerochaetaceae bacterium]